MKIKNNKNETVIAWYELFLKKKKCNCLLKKKEGGGFLSWKAHLKSKSNKYIPYITLILKKKNS